MVKGNTNIGKVLAISKEAFETKVKEETDIINDEVVEEMKYSYTTVKNDYYDDSSKN